MADRFYFRQLLSGRDFARDDMIASQMVNFTYLIGDKSKSSLAMARYKAAEADLQIQL